MFTRTVRGFVPAIIVDQTDTLKIADTGPLTKMGCISLVRADKTDKIKNSAQRSSGLALKAVKNNLNFKKMNKSEIKKQWNSWGWLVAFGLLVLAVYGAIELALFFSN